MHEVPVLDLLGNTCDSIRDSLKGMFQEYLHLRKGKEYNKTNDPKSSALIPSAKKASH